MITIRYLEAISARAEESYTKPIGSFWDRVANPPQSASATTSRDRIPSLETRATEDLKGTGDS